MADWLPAEKRVADYVLNNPEAVVGQGIEALSKKCGVSTASVVRFCRRIGYQGFSDFKRALMIDVVTSPRDIHEDIDIYDPLPVVIEKVFKTAIQTLSDTQAITNIDTIEQAVTRLSKANKVEIYGVGGSGVVALDTHHKFLTIGVPCAAYTDSHLQAMSATLLDKKSVAIGISHSGSTPETIRALRLAKEAGASTIAVTNYRNAPIREYADMMLLTASRESTQIGIPVASRLAQIIVLDALFVALALKRYEQSAENIYRTAMATREPPTQKHAKRTRAAQGEVGPDA